MNILYGGIYPITPPEGDDERGIPYRCFHCGHYNPVLDHYAEDLKMFFHGACVEPYLLTDEGKKFAARGYDIIVSVNGSLKQLQ